MGWSWLFAFLQVTLARISGCKSNGQCLKLQPALHHRQSFACNQGNTVFLKQIFTQYVGASKCKLCKPVQTLFCCLNPDLDWNQLSQQHETNKSAKNRKAQQRILKFSSYSFRTANNLRVSLWSYTISICMILIWFEQYLVGL